MELPDQRSLERRLRQAAPPQGPDPTFTQQLRRALLNSTFYTQPRAAAWLHALRRLLPLASGALAVGFFAALGVSRMQPVPAASKTTAVNPASLQQLTNSGRLHYSHQQPNGVRVYRVDMADGQTLELWDAAPYVLQTSR
ncbi:MAG: hypothetical protein Q7S23_05400 [bacterium]|nr:hypothetical protein [bacterium]